MKFEDACAAGLDALNALIADAEERRRRTRDFLTGGLYLPHGVHLSAEPADAGLKINVRTNTCGTCGFSTLVPPNGRGCCCDENRNPPILASDGSVIRRAGGRLRVDMDGKTP